MKKTSSKKHNTKVRDHLARIHALHQKIEKLVKKQKK